MAVCSLLRGSPATAIKPQQATADCLHYVPLLLPPLLLTLQMKQCYHGFAPPDGSPALVIEPQQDAVLQQLLMENPPTAAADTLTDTIAMSATGGYTYMLGQQGAAAATAAEPPAGKSRGRHRHSRKRMGSLRLVSEERAWQLFELGQQFGGRAVTGEVTPLHIQLRPTEPGAATN